jgi:hypothetical protein
MRTTLLICFLAFRAVASHAQSLDTFVHIDNVVGESLAAGNVNDIVLTAYSQTLPPRRARASWRRSSSIARVLR